jgi:MYXO-CTERM domain-containing protein
VLKRIIEHPGPARLARLAAIVVPVLLAGRPLGDDRHALAGREVPEPHAIDVWGQDTAGIDFDQVAVKAASRKQLAEGLNRAEPRTPAAMHSGFITVGSVALMEADEGMVTRMGEGFGIANRNLPNITTRFIQAFGDDYDQVAVFLSFNDRASLTALAYQLPAANTTRGLGIPVFDNTELFGSKGKMQTVLNMKRIGLYGRGAADDPDSGLYAVWAQEAAHRWLVYFRMRRESDLANNELLLGRQLAHWKNTVQADGSIMDGYTWKDNGDGTFSPMDRGVRYGALDQYGMGLRLARDVPPFFMLEQMTDMDGRPVMSGFARNGRYKARKVDLTVDDIIRAVGPREPDTDPAAEDLRMAVVLVSAPGESPADLIGEAFQIDNTRRLWTGFYNTAGGGRGKVCTELLRPCRGDAYELSDLEVVEASTLVTKDGVATRGEAIAVNVKVTNVGDAPGRARLTVEAQGLLAMSPVAAETGMLAPGQSATVAVPGRVNAAAACAQEFTVDVRTPGTKGPSRAFFQSVLGLQPKQVESFDGGSAPGWRVNPDGDDVGDDGRWALGTPMRSVAFDYTLQPGAAYSGSGAFVTGLSAADVDNVEGKTTLESAPFGVKGLRQPFLSYQVYFVASEFAAELLVPAPAGELRVQARIEGSQGGNAPWVEVDRVTGMATGWQRRLVRLSDKLGAEVAAASDVRFRFVAAETTMSTYPVIEAVIDDVGIHDESPGCDPATPVSPEVPAPTQDAGCSCDLGQGAGGPGGGFAVLVVLGVAILRRRNRARET